jgi:hypothetical protein
MTSFAKALNVTTAGWLAYVVSLGVVLLTDHGELGYVTVGVVLSASMLAWTRRRESRAAFIVSLVLGVLLALQSAAYVAADVGNSPLDARVLTLDLVSLAAGLTVVVGSAWALRLSRVTATSTRTNA